MRDHQAGEYQGEPYPVTSRPRRGDSGERRRVGSTCSGETGSQNAGTTRRVVARTEV
jgi:hypothetical protein